MCLLARVDLEQDDQAKNIVHKVAESLSDAVLNKNTILRQRAIKKENYELVRLYYSMVNESEAGKKLMGDVDASFLASAQDARSAGF